MTEVVKKDGSKQPFNSEKIMNSITAAAKDANLSEELMNEVIEEVSSSVIQFIESKETVTTDEIREKILSELDNVEPSVAAAWRDYEAKKQE